MSALPGTVLVIGRAGCASSSRSHHEAGRDVVDPTELGGPPAVIDASVGVGDIGQRWLRAAGHHREIVRANGGVDVSPDACESR
jgi:hypothetical protein